MFINYESEIIMKIEVGPTELLPPLWVFGLERIERELRDLVDFEGLAWGGPLPLIGLA